MAQRLTLAQMAEQYNKTPKTFKKYVLERGIPHERLGRCLLFDPEIVRLHLTTTEEPQKVATFKPFVPKSRTPTSTLAEALGL